jgi:hypothetical protein
MKSLPIVSIVICGIVALNELAYIGETSLAWVVIGLCVAIALLAVNQMQKD